MKNRVAEILNTKYPLIQAPLNWLTDAEFVAAVSNAGGLGSFGPNAGRDSLEQDSMKVMREQIRKAQQLTNRPFAMTIGLNPQGEDQAYAHKILDNSLAENVSYFIVGGEPDEDIYRQIKASGAVLIARSYNPTPAEAQLQEHLGADLIVATGYDEGGVIPTKGNGTFTTIPRIVDAVSVPVLAAGGITDVRGVRASRALGAEGFYIGSRFIVTKENRTAENAKVKIISSTVEDMVLVAPQQRSIRNAKMDELAKRFADGDHDTFAETRKMGGTRTAMLEGKLEDGEISINTGIDLIQDQPSVAELVQRLMQDYQ
ncbi:nitronate monooxygenase family protein [Fructilactobacillus sanfranciscensis]|uniref:NAD(P)H-dependent flavin oxidoreductase n=1 Tax=Fructilactobacillus sanfranciscensis TaxID=1625 RepID=UPI0023AA8C03|nr:nitronate monooxygenase [Fructilactobacillus sanfranciscensis]WED57698.1 nitronate monooxygenase [Fructilactobacillus sanfranciscensis]